MVHVQCFKHGISENHRASSIIAKDIGSMNHSEYSCFCSVLDTHHPRWLQKAAEALSLTLGKTMAEYSSLFDLYITFHWFEASEDL